AMGQQNKNMVEETSAEKHEISGLCTIEFVGFYCASQLHIRVFVICLILLKKKEAKIVLRSLVPDPMKQEPLLVENVPDPLGGEQTFPTQEDMDLAKEFNRQKRQNKKAVPRGTSEYQAAWFEGDEDSDLENGDDDMLLDDGDNLQDGNHSDGDEDKSSLAFGDSDEETQADTMMTDGEQLTKEQIEAEIRKIKEAHAEDEGIFSPPSYCESLPPDYARLFEFENFARTQKAVLAKAQDVEQSSNEESIPAGSYVRLHVKEVLSDAASKLREVSKRFPVLACGLLQHESKMSVLHFSVKKQDTYDAPIKSKETLIFHVGFRQFVARPIFSSDAIRSGNHKMERVPMSLPCPYFEIDTFLTNFLYLCLSAFKDTSKYQFLH
ncbi:hypothetical protein MKW94_011494, partial [Papaver nudicaule]|nr:hypothetical protein [Papaver nudicaule]